MINLIFQGIEEIFHYSKFHPFNYKQVFLNENTLFSKIFKKYKAYWGCSYREPFINFCLEFIYCQL